VFDCKLHGCSQDLVFPVSFHKLKELFLKLCVYLICVFFVQAEKHTAWSGVDDGVPCGIHCYKLVRILLRMTSNSCFCGVTI